MCCSTSSPPWPSATRPARSRRLTMPMTSSTLSPSTGIRDRPVAIARSRAWRTVAVWAMSTMSMRGTITSRTIVSPNSITEWMKLRSSEAIASSSWATSAIARTSDSVIRWVWRVSPKRPMTPWAIESSKLRDPLDGPELEQGTDDRRRRERRVVGVLDREVLRDRLEDHEDHHDLAHRRDEHARGAEESTGEHADHRRRDQLADQHQQQQWVEELLGRLGELRQRLGSASSLVSKRTSARLVHAHERGLGEREEAREQEQDHHRDREVRVAGGPHRAVHVGLDW